MWSTCEHSPAARPGHDLLGSHITSARRLSGTLAHLLLSSAASPVHRAVPPPPTPSGPARPRPLAGTAPTAAASWRGCPTAQVRARLAASRGAVTVAALHALVLEQAVQWGKTPPLLPSLYPPLHCPAQAMTRPH